MEVTFRAIRLNELETCLDVWDAAFDETPRDYFRKYFTGDPWFQPEYTRCAFEGNRMVSALQIVRREVRVGQATLTLGGIANVGTIPAYRSKGYSTQLLRDAITVMENEGFDFSMLFTGIYGFYARLGWEQLPVPTLSAEIETELPAPEGVYRVRPLADADLDALCACYEQCNAGRSFTVIRSPAYLRGWLGWDEHTPDDAFVAEAAGKLVGYVVAPIGERLSVIEVGWLPAYSECVFALILHVARLAKQRGVTQARLHIPRDPVLMGVVRNLFHHFTWYETTPMVRVIRLQPLMNKLLPELSRRVQMVEAKGAVRLSLPSGTTGLRANGGEVTRDASALPKVVLTQAQFLGLVLGLIGAEELSEPIPAQTRALLNVLFPRQPAIYWAWDGF
ncbi:MAG: GNAT family N-acetyltransferase [Armatimonadota bacterium]|nr:GNAT family N-acetyltransferase [bacterium]MDW8319747.1 GNAT family N-acetyltransferase [Armatimonadota bacterium]